MKKFFYMAVAAIAALSSCTNDDAILNEGGQNENGVTTFTATIDNELATRATFNTTTKKAEWEATTDKISIGGAVYTAQTTGATTTFTGTGAAKGTDQKYHAYFPASLYSGSTASLPATMTLEDGKFNMPMYAESATEVFTFKNLCGVLAITVPQSQMTSVKSIEVSSDKQMNGEIDNVTAEGVLTFKNVTLTDAHKKITLTAASPISIPSGGKTFYVPVPANTHNPLLITISAGTNIKAMVTKKSGGVEVARNTIYPITFNGTSIPAWEIALTLGKTSATSIVIETGVATTTLPIAEDDTHQKLNYASTLWAVLESSGTLKIQTSAPKIKGHNTFSGNAGLFKSYTNVTSITGLDKIDFSEVTNMSYMFKNCNKLTSLDLSSFNTSKVTDMYNMFDGCNALTSLDLSSFNTSNVTIMANMFDGCNALTSLDLSSFDTSKVEKMQYMFSNCNALTSLDLSTFSTSNVNNMSAMFNNCYKLSTLTLSNNFVMTSVTDPNKTDMFTDCGTQATGGCKVYGATGDKDTAGNVKYALSHDTGWNNTYMQFAN